MLQTIAEPRAQVKEYAPKIHVFSIKPEKIKEVIGKGGEMIDKIIEQCDNIKIDFEDDGTCFLTHSNQAIIEKAKNLILEIATDLEVGQSFEAKVVRIADFGLFVQLPKRKTRTLPCFQSRTKISRWIRQALQTWRQYQCNHLKYWSRLKNRSKKKTCLKQ